MRESGRPVQGPVAFPIKVVPIYLLAFSCFQTARLEGVGASDGSSLRPVALGLGLVIFKSTGTAHFTAGSLQPLFIACYYMLYIAC